MTHELLQGGRGHAAHGELQTEMVAQAVHKRIIGQVGGRSVGQALNEVVQRVGAEVAAVVANEERFASSCCHASLATFGQVLVDAVDGVASKRNFARPTRLGPTLDVQHGSVSTADITDAQRDTLTVASTGRGQQVDHCLIASRPRRTCFLRGRRGDFDHGGDVVGREGTNGLLGASPNLKHLVVERIGFDESLCRQPPAEAANGRQLTLQGRWAVAAFEQIQRPQQGIG